MTCLFGQAVLLLGEIGCGSLLGLKGLKTAFVTNILHTAVTRMSTGGVQYLQ